MTSLEILSIVTTLIGVGCFSVVFTILYQSYGKSSIINTESGKRDIELIDAALNEKSATYKRRKNVMSIVKTVLFSLFLIIVIPVLIFSLINRFADSKPIFGKTTMVVASGSMSVKNQANDYLVSNNLNDQFAQYDIIVLDAVNSPSELKRFDIIAFRNDEGVNIIHRIVAVSGSGANAVYTTRGDSNNADDEYRPTFDDVIGVYRGTRVPAVGIVVVFMQSASGIVTVAALLYCLIMIDVVYRKIEKSEEKRLKLLLSAIESDETNAKSMRAEFKETIYYRGFAYKFDEGGFVEKIEVTDGEKQLSDDEMLKVFDDGQPSQKILIETRKDDGKEK